MPGSRAPSPIIPISLQIMWVRSFPYISPQTSTLLEPYGITYVLQLSLQYDYAVLNGCTSGLRQLIPFFASSYIYGNSPSIKERACNARSFICFLSDFGKLVFIIRTFSPRSDYKTRKAVILPEIQTVYISPRQYKGVSVFSSPRVSESTLRLFRAAYRFPRPFP